MKSISHLKQGQSAIEYLLLLLAVIVVIILFLNSGQVKRSVETSINGTADLVEHMSTTVTLPPP